MSQRQWLGKLRHAAAAICAVLVAGCGEDAVDPQAVASPELAAQAVGRIAQGEAVDAKKPGERGDATQNQTKAAADAKGGTEQRAARFRQMANQRLANPTPATPVAIATVKRGSVEAYYHGSTNLTAAEEAVVVARTQGVVEALFVEEGDVVEAGQPLAQLETERLALEVARSKVQLANLKAAYERAERLHEARMVSPNEYDTARFSYQAEATNLQLREFELREATIRATIGGVITRRHVKVGYTLSQNEPAFEMKRLDTVEAELNIPEREIGRIRVGQYARVLIDALADQRFEGDVQRVAPEVDPASGTFRATVVLDNEGGRLRPGMFARVQVRTDRRDDALTAPLEAVVALRDKSSLFVVADGVAERRAVTTGYVSDGVIEILTGAEEGEQVVMTGQDGLRDGARVTVVDGYPALADS